jgi:hypothetical protein
VVLEAAHQQHHAHPAGEVDQVQVQQHLHRCHVYITSVADPEGAALALGGAGALS